MIYMDNCATTELSPKVVVDICKNLNNYGNPSGLYNIGYKARQIIEGARIKVARAIHADFNQIFFTSGATESNNWVASMFDWISANYYEHHSIINQNNFVPIVFKENTLSRETQPNYVYSQMLVNNEVGFINDVKNYLKKYKDHGSYTHSDITQAIDNIHVDIKDLNVDFASFSGHKFNAPKGVGVLYVKDPEDRVFSPYHYGGQQESYMRAGTENVIGISAMGVAIEEAVSNIDIKQKHCKILRDRFIHVLNNYGLNFIVNGTDLNVDGKILDHVDSILSLSFKGQDSSSMLVQLDMKNICCSAGSSCNSGDSEPSETLKYLNIPNDYINGTLRFSFSLNNTVEEVDTVCYNLNKIIRRE